MMRSSTSPLAVSMMIGTSEVSRMRGRRARPAREGSMRSKNDQIEVMLLELLQGVLAVTDGGHPVVLALQIGRHRIADGLSSSTRRMRRVSLLMGIVSLHVRLQFLGCQSFIVLTCDFIS